MDDELNPRLNMLNRYLHRRFVRWQHVRDEKTQVRKGLTTFPTDWYLHIESAEKPRERIPRKLWMLWLQGEEEAPPLVKASFESWRRRNPDWNIQVLNENTVRDFVEVPEFPEWVSPNHKANIIRLLLLDRYGGVWTDATTLCLKPLDEWIDHSAPQGFFAFTRPQPLRAVANWFIAAELKSPFIKTWLAWSKIYLLSNSKPESYFWSHFTFNWLLRRNETVRDLWIKTPQITARGPHILQRVLDGDLNEKTDPSHDQMALLPLVKLNWKKGYTLQSIDKELTTRGIELEAIRQL